MSIDSGNGSVASDDQSPLYGFTDNYVSIVPIKVVSNVKRDQACYSFVLLPKQDRGKFQPSVAIKLGCVPNKHFRVLTEGNPVTLDDGTVINPS
jgi:hypothetical protein